MSRVTPHAPHPSTHPHPPRLKAPGAIIEQPDANYMYGADASAPNAPAPYPSPMTAARS
jgi:hypothetical protein